MNCKPGDLARIVGVKPALRMALDKIVRITDEPAFPSGDGMTWRLVEPVCITLLESGRSLSGKQFWIGESVWFSEIPDRYLRPIRNQPGEDETLQWAPVPGQKVEVPA